MNNFRTRNSLHPTSPLTQQARRGSRPIGGLPAGVLPHWWIALLSLAACASDSGGDSSPAANDPVSISTTLQDMIVAGNEPIIDLAGVFGGGSGELTYGVSLGSIGADGKLTISDAEFTEGTHLITITATDADGNAIEHAFELVSDKTPTIATPLQDMALSSSSNTISLVGVFGGGSSALNLTASAGTIGENGILTLGDAELPSGTNTISVTITATDTDGDAIEEVIELTSANPTIVTAIADASIAGNDGTVIDISGVFGHPIEGEILSLSASKGTIGSNNSLTLTGADLADGANTIILTATDTDSVTPVISTFVLTTNKSPTIANELQDTIVSTNGGTINLAEVFGGGSDPLTFAASDGTNSFGTIANNILSLGNLPVGTYIITITATDSDGETIEETVELTSATSPTIGITIPDTTVAGNAATIDLDGVFVGGSSVLTLTTSLGSIVNNQLIISDAIFTEGTHMITITGTDDNSSSIKQTFELFSDKSPTVTSIIANETLAVGNNGATIDISGVFGHPVVGEQLTLSASKGTIGSNNSLTLTGDDLANGENTIILTATDDDATNKDSITSTFVVTTDKSPTVTLTITDETLAVGNDGTTIDVSTVFANGSGELKLTASKGTIGSNNSLTLAGADLDDGANTIILTATDEDATNKESVTSTFVITTDKSPTVTSTIANETLAKGNDGITIDVSGVFGHPKVGEELTLSASKGTIGNNNSLTLAGADLDDGANTIILTATDNDATNKESVTSTFMVTTDKSPTIANALETAIVPSNGGTINLAGIFDGGSGELTLTASTGTVANNILTLGSLAAGTHIITITATDKDGDSIEEIVELTSVNDLTVAITIPNTIVAGNAATIDLDGAFVGGSGTLTLTTSFGSIVNNELIISDALFTEGTHTIVITATDGNASIKQTFDLVSDKSPTVTSIIADETLAVGNGGAIIDVSGVFGHPVVGEQLTLSASKGTIGSNNSLTLTGADLADGENTIILTATDDDATNKDSITSTFLVTTDKSPTVTLTIADETLAVGNGGTTIDVSGVFANGSGELKLTASKGTVGDDKSLTLAGADLDDGANTIILTATDEDATNKESVTSTFMITTDKAPIVVTAIGNATLAVGNDGTTIDVSGVFGHPKVGEELTLSTSKGTIGSNNSLTLTGADLADGENTIILTATDNDATNKESITSTFVVTTDKAPTVVTAIGNATLAVGNDGTTIDVSGVFGHPVVGEELTLSASKGTIGNDNSLTLTGADLTDGANTIILTATDDDATNKDIITSTFVLTTDKTPIVVTAIADATLAVGNDGTTIDISGVFGHPVVGEELMFTASKGTVGNNNSLTLTGDDLDDGTNTITLTATDADATNKDIITSTFVLTTDKSPTVTLTIEDETLAKGNHGVTIDVSRVFANGSGELKLTASAGTVGNNNSLTLAGADLDDGTNTIILTATDNDVTNKESVTSTFVVTTDKSPTIANALQDAIVPISEGTIDLTGVFDGGGVLLTLSASDGTNSFGTIANNILSLGNLPVGTYLITITATDNNGDSIEEIVELTSATSPTIGIIIPDTTVAGNAATIDLDGVFVGGSSALTLTTSFGSIVNNQLIISDAMFTEGTHIITITGTDDNSSSIEQTFDLVSDKTPTVTAAINVPSITGNDGTIIAIGGVFGHPVVGEVLTLTASKGIVTNNMLILAGTELDDGANTITLTATDDDATNKDSVTSTFVVTTDKSPTILTAVPDATVAGNDTIIDLDGVFDNGSGELTFFTSLGNIVGNNLILSDAVFTNGTHVITITARDTNGDEVEDIVELVSDKSPTVVTAIGDATLAKGNDGTAIDISGVFAISSGVLSIDASIGTVTNNMLILTGTELADGANTIVLTATDNDLTDKDSITSTFVLTTDKSPTILTSLQDATVAGNDATIDIGGVFDNGSGELMLTTSFGSIVGNDLILSDVLFTEGTHSITITATDTNNDEAEEVVVLISDKTPTIVTSLQDATVAGNDTLIDLDTVFGGGSGMLTFDATDGTASIGSIVNDNSLSLSDAEFTEGTHIITITATDNDGDKVEDIVVLVSDKSPTIITALQDTTVAGNHTIIDLNALFGGGSGGSGMLTFDASDGTAAIGSIANNSLTLSDAVFTEGTHTITITARDPDGDAVEETVVLVSDKTPTVANMVADATMSRKITTINLAGVFDNGSGNLSLDTSHGTVGSDNKLTFADSDLGDGANTLIVTATDADGDTITDMFVITKTLAISDDAITTIYGAWQHDFQTFDAEELLVTTSNLSYGTIPQGGIGRTNNIIEFTNTKPNLVNKGVETFTITVTDGDDDTKVTHTLTYTIDTIKDQNDGSGTTFNGTNMADAITGNTFSGGIPFLQNVTLNGWKGNDNISSNEFEHTGAIGTITLAGGEGDDTINSNTFTAPQIFLLNFNGNAGDDTISGNTFTGGTLIGGLFLNGGAGNDTISNNTVTGGSVSTVTFSGGDGDDIFSGNLFKATGSAASHDADVSLNGGAGDDMFVNNTATQANGELAKMTIDGGEGFDSVRFSLNHDPQNSILNFNFSGNLADGLTVSNGNTNNQATSYANYILIDIEEVYFGTSQDAYVF